MKVQTGIRVDRLVSVRFKDLCRAEKLMVGEAVQHFMEACLEAGSVIAVLGSREKGAMAQRKADELRLRGALAMLRGFTKAVSAKKWYVEVRDKETRIDQAIYGPAYDEAVSVLPKIQDEQLLREAERVLKEANKAVERVVGI